MIASRAAEYPDGVQRLSLSVADLTQAAVFAALIAVLGVPGQLNLSSGVPITLQSMGVMMAGAILGPKKGTLAVLIFMVLALAGLPILAGGRTGMVSLSSPTGGFFVAFLPAAFVIGLATAMMMPRYRLWLGFVINALGGALLVYVIGSIWLMVRADMSVGAAAAVNGPFIIGDLLKAAVAALVAQQVHRGRPGLIPPIRLRRTAVPAQP
ncbi:biotin transporter BioY [Gordonia sp. VNK21]|uniref:biotin transporter BioY n=1 Tax=Gordonia sp. VNK21 TaxID=3382483 RepID=UPI0038D463EC